ALFYIILSPITVPPADRTSGATPGSFSVDLEHSPMAEPLIDLKALLVEHEDCDAGTVTKLRNGLAQGGTQFRSLREAAEALQKRIDAGQGNAKKLHLKLGI